ncbi:hypothetical protein BFP72_11510 [Reichenbachiella sp. 5M10]|uniref:hypothetical protein n=1 Tax=Reichenbachiella sp. 5M10 TaxID=1889772 RepID=UPI000C1581DC|nr:hypothetical protein [Reichenbachiella sp. 5M10]PIB35978.1 hypothetical protein BFP72_11510 [Reichenbachiella sp. 5M10]
MTIQFKNGEEYYNKIYTVFNLSVAITLLPFGYLVLEKHSGRLESLPISSWQLWVITLPLLLIIALLIRWSQHTFKAEKEAARQVEGLRPKLLAFYNCLFKRFAVFTGISGLSTVMLYLTGSGFFIMAYVGAMIFLSLSRPTLNLIIEALQLNPTDEQILIEKKDIP